MMGGMRVNDGGVDVDGLVRYYVDCELGPRKK